MCDFCRCGIVIGCHRLCSVDRCLQCLEAFRCVVSVKVSICGRDQRVQLCLGDDLPQLLCRLGHRFVRCFQRICARIRVSEQFFRCGDCVFQRLHLARTNAVYIGQDVFLDEVDRCLHVFAQGVFAFIGVECLHRFAQVEQRGDDLGRGRRFLGQYGLCIGDRFIQRRIIRTKRDGLVDHVAQCLYGCFACLVNRITDFHQCGNGCIQCFCSLVNLYLLRRIRFTNFNCLMQFFDQSFKAFRSILVFFQCLCFLYYIIQHRAIYSTIIIFNLSQLEFS